jgi:phosphonate transport system permease protein
MSPANLQAIGQSSGEPAAAARVDRLHVAFSSEVAAIEGASLVIERGRHTILIGPSGSGKSTLLACLAGVQRASAGTIEVSGRTARIHQDLRLVPQETALANVLHGALGRLSLGQSLRFPGNERQRAEGLLRRVGLGHRVNALVRTLSGGEAQRVAIARALMQDPDILLADEPVSSLDPETADDIMRLLDDLRLERGLTLVTVLHDHHLAKRYADRLVGMEQGGIRSDSAQPTPPPAAKRPTAPPPQPEFAWSAAKPFSMAWLIWVGVAALLAWAWTGLNTTPGQFEDALGTGLGFLAQLVPTSEELRDLDWASLLAALVDTLKMALLGTAASVVLALPLSGLAARNVAPRWIGAPLRAFLNWWRSVPSIVWALLFVAAVGLGPVAGVLALVVYSMGYLTKFFYEGFEGVDRGAPDALAELGANGPQRFLHAVWPMSKPAIVAACLFMLEYNVRAASVLGIVGAGGIGHDLKLAVEWSNWHVVGVILVLFGLTVMLVDALSSALRKRLV